MNRSILRRITASALAAIMALGIAACGEKEPQETQPPETQLTTEAPQTETEAPEVQPVPTNINMLTGLEAEKDMSTSRPVAVMLNNLRAALPQHSVGQCDILYECLAEGGITRLMGVYSDYAAIGVIGSVRSSRHYYIDLAQNHDALYVHAGGSDYAYNEIRSRKIDNFDGVNMNIPNMFYRDKNRLETMSMEHTLMTTGEKIVNGIAYKKYRTELKDSFSGKTAFNFAPLGENAIDGGEASTRLYLPYSKYQQAKFEYNAEDGKYYRYQFADKDNLPHMDGNTNEQISFDNIFVVFCPTVRIKGDTYGRLDVTTEGKGDGYYISGGKYVPITWEKPTADSAITYFAEDGSELEVNRGKTFVSIFPADNKNAVKFN